MKLPLAIFDASILRKKAQKVEVFDHSLKELVANMVETMDGSNGQGLAAPQVHSLLRVFVVRFYRQDEKGHYHMDSEPTVFINPKVSNVSEELSVLEEGCLSIPGITGEVVRPQRVHIEAQTVDGEFFSMDLTDPLHTRVVLHENDHLNGVLFIDRMDKRERKKLKPHLERLKKRAGK